MKESPRANLSPAGQRGLPLSPLQLETVDKWVGREVLRLRKGGPEAWPITLAHGEGLRRTKCIFSDATVVFAYL
jgi:hypothetical protein